MRILAVGGGSGGHVTPVVAVLKALRAERPHATLRFWSDKKFAAQARAIVTTYDPMIRLDTITAGKLRRYHHLTVWQQLTWPSLVFSNLRDAFLVVIGFIESVFKLIIWRPDVIFTKGGYVCLPVGMAAHLLRIPLVIHDSDAHPGLTNRILSRWAVSIATGAPLEYYPYDKKKSHYVGIPIDQAFRPFTPAEKSRAKSAWGISDGVPLVVVTGGGLGASRLNQAVVDSLTELQKFCAVVLLSGSAQYEEMKRIMPANHDKFQLHPFTTDMANLLGAADVVVTRAGATTLLELAALQKPTVLVPNAKLTGGHQIKNAAVYVDAQAAVMIDETALEDNPQLLVQTVRSLLDDPEQSAAMAARFHAFSRPHAARDVARLILKAARRPAV